MPYPAVHRVRHLGVSAIGSPQSHSKQTSNPVL